MIHGIGTDLVEFERIKRIERKEAFIEKILSPKEKAFFDDLKNPVRQLEFISGRFALKEALFKAWADFCRDRNFSDFCILPNEHGAPVLLIGGSPPKKEVHLTLSHSENYVIAFVIVME